MKLGKSLLIVALAGGLATAGALSAAAGDDAAEKSAAEKDAAKRAALGARIGAAVKRAKVSLAEACSAAEKATGGRAVSARLEAEEDEDEAEYEVLIVTIEGEKVTLREVDVDGVSGKVETEEEGDDDGDDEDEKDDADEKDEKAK